MSLFAITKILIKSVWRRPATVRVPFVKKTVFARTRGLIAIEIKKCIYCGMCQRKCPTRALAVSKTDKTWTMDRLRCIWCRACVEVCPVKCLGMEARFNVPTSKREKEIFRA